MGPDSRQRSGELAEDLLRGAEAIATFIFGEADSAKKAEANRRRTYHAISKGQIPTFRIGSIIHARKSSILKSIEKQEHEGQGTGL